MPFGAREGAIVADMKLKWKPSGETECGRYRLQRSAVRGEGAWWTFMHKAQGALEFKDMPSGPTKREAKRDAQRHADAKMEK